MSAPTAGPSTSTSVSASAPSTKSKKREKKAQASAQPAERLKVIVRRLPADLPEEIFWRSVERWVSDDAVSWKMFYPGKARKRPSNKENIPARAYIAFKASDQVATFGREYDGHVFQDKAGNITAAVVEFAPYQKMPPEKKKVDARMNTIEIDEDYISFMASLQASSTKRTEADTLEAFTQTHTETAPKTTPLLEALKAERAAQKDKMSVMRNHAHYKDISVTGIISSKNAARPEGQLRDGKKDKKKDKKDKDAPPALAPGDKKRGKSGQANPAVAGPSKSTPAPAAAATPAPATGVKPATAGSKKSRKRGGPADSSSSASTEPAPVPAPAQSSTTPVTPLSSQQSAPVETKPQSDAAPTRRGRPTLGLASRQFAAALSGAGVQAKKSERNVSVVAESGATVASSDTSPSVEIVSRGGGRGRGRGRAGGRGGAA